MTTTETPVPPKDATRITKLRWIVTNRQCLYVEGHLVDLTSARMFIHVWDNIKDTSRRRLDEMPIPAAIALIYKVSR